MVPSQKWRMITCQHGPQQGQHGGIGIAASSLQSRFEEQMKKALPSAAGCLALAFGFAQRGVVFALALPKHLL